LVRRVQQTIWIGLLLPGCRVVSKKEFLKKESNRPPASGFLASGLLVSAYWLYAFACYRLLAS
jgi:hypothetical protein